MLTPLPPALQPPPAYICNLRRRTPGRSRLRQQLHLRRHRSTPSPPPLLPPPPPAPPHAALLTASRACRPPCAWAVADAAPPAASAAATAPTTTAFAATTATAATTVAAAALGVTCPSHSAGALRRRVAWSYTCPRDEARPCACTPPLRHAAAFCAAPPLLRLPGRPQLHPPAPLASACAPAASPPPLPAAASPQGRRSNVRTPILG